MRKHLSCRLFGHHYLPTFSTVTTLVDGRLSVESSEAYVSCWKCGKEPDADS